MIQLGQHVDIIMGQAPPGNACNKDGIGTPFVKAGEFSDTGPIIREWTTKPLKLARRNDVLVCVVGATAGKINRGADCAIGRSVAAVRPLEDKINSRYLLFFLQGKVSHLRRKSQGLAQGVITRDMIESLQIPLPPLDEQKRIAAILDKADALRRKRRQALALLDSLTQSIFLEMFGDPAINIKKFPLMRVGDVAIKYSDGPFGSNLKSEHYVDQGVRVIRLQNIGVGEFIDKDRAYITEEHFRKISKHECRPGDVIVGTLGEPNLRACLQPAWLHRAINKADCVQLRPDPKVAIPEYCVCLINQESTMRLAQGLVLGQTRGRVSMGRLRELELPIAPLPLQIKFASIHRTHQKQKWLFEKDASQLDSLFASLQHRAFSGQL